MLSSENIQELTNTDSFMKPQLNLHHQPITKLLGLAVTGSGDPNALDTASRDPKRG